jgi:uncharacterized SAM-binding protein YcdF (DUF218 family)
MNTKLFQSLFFIFLHNLKAMFFILSKLLYYLFSPITLILASFISSLFLKNKIWKKRLFITGFSFLLLFTNPFIINELFRAWEVKPVNMNAVKDYDVAIVLSGMTKMQTGYNDRIHFADGIDRLLHPYQLYKEGRVKKILITGGSGSLVNQEKREADELLEYLIAIGMPKEDVIIERDSRNTRENAVFTKELLEKKYPQYSRFLMVTSAFHMRRSIGCFEKANLKVTPFATDYYTHRTVFYPNMLLPNENALGKWFTLYHEALGFCIYKLMGYS